MNKLWNKYFPIFAMNLAEKNFENMDQTMFFIFFSYKTQILLKIGEEKLSSI